jgi:NAD(P)-dependent dehydrogenase (short-subunit alcohol dehydrogenase family)
MPVALIVTNRTVVSQAVASQLRDAGWDIRTEGESTEPVDAVLFDPGMLDVDAAVSGAATALLDLAERTTFRPRADGGAALVAIGSRDQLGSAGAPELAAEAGALATMVRSLALRLAPSGVTVNLVAGLSAVLGSPQGLLPEAVPPEDIAATAVFLLDPRSRYITGQLLFCCGGASLLSSMSV